MVCAQTTIIDFRLGRGKRAGGAGRIVVVADERSLRRPPRHAIEAWRGPENGATHLIEFDGVGMHYGAGRDVLRDVNFKLADGSFHFLTGASGAGKTSLMRLMYLAHQPTSGAVHLLGKNTGRATRDELAQIRRRIGFVFQEFRLLDHLTAVENVALPLRIAGRKGREVDSQVRELLSWVGLADHLDAHPSTMSGGQQQRVSIARAVINRPRLLLADEPTGNVDDATAARLMYLFEELNKMGTTVVIATHNEALIRRFDHPVLQLEAGRLAVLPPMRKGNAA